MSKTKKTLLGGNVKSIPAFYSGQDASGKPNHYITVDEARKLREKGKAISINRGLAILIMGPRKFMKYTKESKKTAWKVVGQTTKSPDRPGFPRWAGV